MDKTFDYQSVEEKLSSHLGLWFGITSVIILGTWWAILATAVSWLWNQ